MKTKQHCDDPKVVSRTTSVQFHSDSLATRLVRVLSPLAFDLKTLKSARLAT